MTTQVDDSGLQFIADHIAGQNVTISVHTGDPGASGSANELPTGAGRNYTRKTENASEWTRTDQTVDNDNSISVFTPSSTEAGTVVNHIGIRFGGTWYARIELVAPVTLIENHAFRIAAGTIDLMFSR